MNFPVILFLFYTIFDAKSSFDQYKNKRRIIIEKRVISSLEFRDKIYVKRKNYDRKKWDVDNNVKYTRDKKKTVINI